MTFKRFDMRLTISRNTRRKEELRQPTTLERNDEAEHGIFEDAWLFRADEFDEYAGNNVVWR